MTAERRRALAWAAGAAAMPALLYALTAAPTVTGEDSGELAAAAWTLGVPHPSGFPLWCITAKLFATLLLPFGDVAWRMAIFSGVTVALAMALLHHVLDHLTDEPLGALLCVWLIAASRTLWSQAVIVEVYPLNTLALCALLALLETAGFESVEHRALLLGAAQIVTGIRRQS